MAFPDIPEEHAQPELLSLHQRLLAAEEMGAQVSRELSWLSQGLTQLSWELRNSSTNSTDGSRQTHVGAMSPLHWPSAFSYLPHLREHPDSLTPHVLLGQGRTGVRREKQSYLISTLGSLFYDLPSDERDDILVIILVAEADPAYVDTVVEDIKKNFPSEVQSGLLEVISPSPYFYPNFSRLKETFGDTKERVMWRTKQNLDYSFLMLYSQQKGSYYVQLEDDIVAKPGYSQTMKTFASQQSSEEWLILEFSQLGFIGKMFRMSDLPMLVEFFLMFYKDKPIDWLLDHILWVKVCHPEKDAKHCSRQKDNLKRRYKPSLFQHVGLHSSLRGKIQNLKDKDFGTQTLYKGHSNPAAVLTSSLSAYQSHTLIRAYQGEDFFWALTPSAGDFIQISFLQEQTVKGYLFRSGNIETNGDKFYNTTVEVLPTNSSFLDNMESGQIPKYKQSKDGFIVIGAFANGVAEGAVEPELQKISAIRLVVNADSDVWVLLSEIFIKV
ncbi:hypothetical protein MATL_G00192460 [Megalops atlanticus]|uniref:Alpha-1,3-mannosyl-glycoprotein 4-beta-N-acetylglucosaminyltransferase B n=1 Tax=Megalops atlanticus TaxID=7932 RepID=A0A9D3PMZ1_MEGAT|nr:hypothetical protein MATL_G00192460 [Megalops atlanticus]